MEEIMFVSLSVDTWAEVEVDLESSISSSEQTRVVSVSVEPSFEVSLEVVAHT